MPDKSNVHWPIYDVMPDGWRFDRTCGSPLAGYEFASDGVSILRGGKRALVAASVKKMDDPVYTYTPAIKQEKAKPLDDAARLAMNNLARAKLKEQLLKDITIDLMVCKIEGWSYSQYAAELYDLIGSVYESTIRD